MNLRKLRILWKRGADKDLLLIFNWSEYLKFLIPVEILKLLLRNAKKIHIEMQEKIEEWKFETGAVIMCMVAYKEGNEVRALQ